MQSKSPQGERPTGDYEQAEAVEPKGSRSESPAHRSSNQQCAPCPFCGGAASVWGSWLYSSRGPFSGHVHCETPNCSHGPEGRGKTIEEAGNAAIAAWNKRSSTVAINPADFEKWRAADETDAEHGKT